MINTVHRKTGGTDLNEGFPPTPARAQGRGRGGTNRVCLGELSRHTRFSLQMQREITSIMKASAMVKLRINGKKSRHRRA